MCTIQTTGQCLVVVHHSFKTQYTRLVKLQFNLQCLQCRFTIADSFEWAINYSFGLGKLFLCTCLNLLICCNCLIGCSFCFFFQSKEIAFQLQEDLMKVLNELYTVSINDCPLFLLMQIHWSLLWLRLVHSTELTNFQLTA